MSAVLAISSQVAAGPVGNSAIVPALQALGVAHVAVPTVIQSNHPGHGPFERLGMPAATLGAMLRRLDANGFLGPVGVVLTGYFIEAGQVEEVAGFIARWKPRYALCDPVVGDTHAGLYVKPEVAAAIRELLVPLADGLTPNAFELGWLAGAPVSDLAGAVAAARKFPGKDVIVTSIPAGPDALTTALIRDDVRAAVTRPRLAQAPQHGTGDLFAGLLAGSIARDVSIEMALGGCVMAVEQAIAASGGTSVLDLSAIRHICQSQEWIG